MAKPMTVTVTPNGGIKDSRGQYVELADLRDSGWSQPEQQVYRFACKDVKTGHMVVTETPVTLAQPHIPLQGYTTADIDNLIHSAVELTTLRDLGHYAISARPGTETTITLATDYSPLDSLCKAPLFKDMRAKGKVVNTLP